MPSSLGIFISKIAISGEFLCKAINPFSPSGYVSTYQPSALKAKETDTKILLSSSTKIIFSLMIHPLNNYLKIFIKILFEFIIKVYSRLI
jgi:hypothetical protein